MQKIWKVYCTKGCCFLSTLILRMAVLRRYNFGCIKYIFDICCVVLLAIYIHICVCVSNSCLANQVAEELMVMMMHP